MRYLKVVVISLFLVLALLVPTLVKAQAPSLEKRLAKLEKKVRKLEAKLANVRVEDGEINGLRGPHFIIEGVNVHIQSGSDLTDDGTFFDETLIEGAELLGLGNLVMGYNENGVFLGEIVKDRTGSGSHNLIMGVENSYTSFSGIVNGGPNTISGPASSVLAGAFNTASGIVSSVSGGIGNTASGDFSSVSGGSNRTAGLGVAGDGVAGDNDWAAGSLFEDN